MLDEREGVKGNSTSCLITGKVARIFNKWLEKSESGLIISKPARNPKKVA
jgi:hypothetical protein